METRVRRDKNDTIINVASSNSLTTTLTAIAIAGIAIVSSIISAKSWKPLSPEINSSDSRSDSDSIFFFPFRRIAQEYTVRAVKSGERILR